MSAARNYKVTGVKRLYIFIVVLVVILASGGFLFFKFWYTDKTQQVWELVPHSAILVYESNNTVRDWNDVQAKTIWTNLERIPYYANIGNSIELLDSLSGSQGHLDKLVQGKPFVFSIHKVSQDALDVLFFVKLDNVSDYDVLTKLVAQFKSRDDFEFQTRTYQDFTINEAVNEDYDQIFSYIVHKNYFVGSFAPVLVEDVIRKIAGLTEDSFGKANPQLAEVAKLDNDQGNLYIDNRKLPQLFSVFIDESQSQDLTALGALAESSFLDVKFTDEHILFNGFTLLDQSGSQYLQSVKGSQGKSLGFKDLLSSEVGILYHITFEDPEIWHNRLRTFWNSHDREQLKAWDELGQSIDWEPSLLTRALTDEVGYAIMEISDEEEPDRLVYLKFSDFNEGLLQLNRVAENSANAAGDSLYTEQYAGKEIRQISIENFPQKIFGHLFTGFEQTFYLPFEDYIILSNSIQALKNLVRAVEAQDTWGKSIKMEQFLERTLAEANLSVFMDLDKTWNILHQQLAPPWIDFMDQHEKVIKGFDLLAFQFSDIGDKFYSSGILTYQPSVAATPQVAQQFNTLQQAYTNSPIISRPYVVTNHNNGSREVLVQDSLNVLYQISSQGRVLWYDTLNTSIQGEVSQIDYYRNNKLQYLLATNNAVHIIDRNGESIEGYPVNIPTETGLRNVRAIDYDNSKNYRIISSDDNGQIFMMDKQGKLLEGWDPKIMDDQLIAAPQHIRVRGKDCIIAVQKNGVIQIMNRRGQPYPGFPLDLKGPTQSGLFMEIGTNFQNTYFTTISTSGLILKFNLEGTVLQRQQLLKPSRDTRYQLCVDALKKNYVISRQNANRLGILNRKGEVILEKDYLTSGSLKVQYYKFANDHSIFAVSDPIQQFTYFYTDEGILVNAMPIENARDVGILYFENQQKHHVYNVYDRKFSILSF